MGDEQGYTIMKDIITVDETLKDCQYLSPLK